MDVFDSGQRLSDLGEDDFNEFLQNDVFDSPSDSACVLEEYNMETDEWFNSLFGDPVLNDKMMTDAAQPPHIQSEHSYSQMEDKQAVLSLLVEDNKDLDPELFPPAHTCVAPQELTHQKTTFTMAPTTIVKQETNDVEVDVETSSHNYMNQQPTIILATTHTTQQQNVPKVSIKLEPSDVFNGYDSIRLPLTPPGSSSSSDSESGSSPSHSAPCSPVHQINVSRSQMVKLSTSTATSPFQQPLFVNPIPQSGILVLTEEEKRTLVQEGYLVPNKLPLTKIEEKNLKKIRRKIKNKISAQESRRKKKEYLDCLEKRVDVVNQENSDLRKKVDNLETNNRSLLYQLQKFQALVKNCRPSSPKNQGTCLMVLVLCFAVFLGTPGSWSPSSTLNIGYTNKLPKMGHMAHGSCHLENPILGYHGRIGSPGGHAMGPLHKGLRDDTYHTANIRSRVLLALHDQEDTTRYEPYGPHMPFEYKEIAEKNNPHLTLGLEPPVVTIQGDPDAIHSVVFVSPLGLSPQILHVVEQQESQYLANVTANLVNNVNATLA